MVRMDNKVQPHQVHKVLILSETELVGQVEAIVLILLDGSNFSILEDIAVDLGGDCRKLGNQIHRIFEGVVPVVLLIEAFGVRLREL